MEELQSEINQKSGTFAAISIESIDRVYLYNWSFGFWWFCCHFNLRTRSLAPSCALSCLQNHLSRSSSTGEKVVPGLVFELLELFQSLRA